MASRKKEVVLEATAPEAEVDDWNPGDAPGATAEKDERRAALAKMAGRIEGFRPAREVLTRVRSVPTRFAQFDWATRVHGFPLQRFSVIHGPSSEGKTSFMNGIGESFLRAGHFFLLIDAEFTTPITWLEGLMSEHADNPAFLALRPHTYEETVKAVRDFLTTLAESKARGSIPADTTAFIGLDSIRKLVPKRLLDKLNADEESDARGRKQKDGGIDGMSGRAAQFKAYLNSAWLDELVPLLYHSGGTMLTIARESENTESKGMFDQEWKMTGGKGLEFDSSLIARISRAGWVKEGSGKESRVIGEKHAVEIRKTKVAGKQDKTVVSHFHTSNGLLVPEGFDRARDVIELGIHFGVVQQSGAWYAWQNKRFNGINQMVVRLTNEPSLLDVFERQVRERFNPDDDAETLPEASEIQAEES